MTPPTRCNVCNSSQKDYIEEQIVANVPFSLISSRMSDVYSETISKDSLKNHKAKHMTSPNNLAKEIADPSKSGKDNLAKMLEPPLSEMEALKARVNALELVSWISTNAIQYTGWVSYSIKGPTSHQITYQGIVEELMPNTHNIKDQYKKFVTDIKKRRIEEDGEPLTDEFVNARADLKAKTLEEAKIAAAEAEIKELMANKQAAQDKITSLSEERQQEIKDNDAAAAKWFAEQELEEKTE